MNDAKLDSPSFHRNVGPIISLFKEKVQESDLMWLEIGSGSGQHVERFAQEFPSLEFQPTDIDRENLASIKARTTAAELSNVKPPINLDVTMKEWPLGKHASYDIISAFNVIHIAPWEVTKGLFRGASLYGSNICRIFLYGPFKIDGEQTSESNANFEEWLKGKDEAFGIRDIGDVSDVARDSGFTLSELHPMPANNFMMEFARASE